MLEKSRKLWAVLHASKHVKFHLLSLQLAKAAGGVQETYYGEVRSMTGDEKRECVSLISDF